MFFDIFRKCRCQKTPQLSNSDTFLLSYEHLKSTEAIYSLAWLRRNFVIGALWKFLAAAFTKLRDTLLVNFFMISVVGYHTSSYLVMKEDKGKINVDLCLNAYKSLIHLNSEK